MHKGAVFSDSTTILFRLAPGISLASLLTASLLLPFGQSEAVISFAGDFILFVALLALSRLMMIIAALDTGSAFEGMGASRDIIIAMLTEPTLMLTVATLANVASKSGFSPTGLEKEFLSLSLFHTAITLETWSQSGIVLLLLLMPLSVILLAENARMPFVDPSTHLELTMVHEVMVLDHSGPDLGLIQYAQMIKFWLLGSLFIGLSVPFRTTVPLLDTGIDFIAMIGLAIAIGIIESSSARIRWQHFPQLLISAMMLALMAFVLGLEGIIYK